MASALKVAIVSKGIGQTRMAVELGWDPAKLSRIVNGLVSPHDDEITRIANYLGMSEKVLFPDAANGLGVAERLS